jgi:DNA polymerase I-like protein with 3'-5' exonuclease and polymerase domains
MIDWNYWKNWNWFRELRNPDWALEIKKPARKNEPVPLRLNPPEDLILIDSESAYQELIQKIKDAKYIGFDTEANNKNPFAGDFEVAGLCFAFDVVQGYYLPLNHKTPDAKFSKLFKNYKLPYINFDQKKVMNDLLRVGFMDKPIICHSSSYELHVEYQLSRVTQTLDYIGHRGPVLDTLFYYRVQDPIRDNGLKGITASMFGYTPIEFSEAVGKDQTFNQTDPRVSKDYAAADAVNTLRHAFFIMNQNFNSNVYDVCNVLEWPLAARLPEVEQFGVRIDVPKLQELSSIVKPHLKVLAREARKVIGRDINPNSNDEKFNLLFTELRAPLPQGSRPEGTGADDIKEIKLYIPTLLDALNTVEEQLKDYTKGRQGIDSMVQKVYRVLSNCNTVYTKFQSESEGDVRIEEYKEHINYLFDTINSTRERLKKLLSIVAILTNYVTLSKLNSAFLESLPKKVSSQDGLLHTRFNQIVRSGRQSGTSPNLMQVPRDEEYTIRYDFLERDEINLITPGIECNEDKEIKLIADVRECILPPEDWIYVRADLDAAEMRMLAAISGCPILTSVVMGVDEEGDTFDPHLKSVELLKLMSEDYITLKKALGDKAHKLHKTAKHWRQMIKPINFGLCLKKGTKILTENGYKNIEDIKVGDQVVTHKKRLRTVTQLQRPTAKKLYRIKTRSGKEFWATPDHMMLKHFPSARGKADGYGWVRCDDLVVGDYLTYHNTGWDSGSKLDKLNSEAEWLSGDKYIPEYVFGLDKPSRLQVLAGLWNGDGCINLTKKGRLIIRYSSKSRQLLKDIVRLLDSVGINATIYDFESRKNGEVHVLGSACRDEFIKNVPTFKVNYAKNYKPKKKWDCEEKIVSIEIEDVSETVYDFTVEEDHSFIANGLVSHNCYGITEFGLAAQLDVTPEFARKLMNMYFELYTGVARWLKEAHEQAGERGYSETVIGRRRTIPEFAYEDENELKHYIRACGNHVIQGNITGDIAKFCERQAIDALSEFKHITRRTRAFTNYIHDEFVIACINEPEVVQYCAAVLWGTMQKTVSGIPFTCGVEVTETLSKKSKNLIDKYPDFKSVELINRVAKAAGVKDHKELNLLPWWGPEADALL